MKFSIITATYNSSSTIAETLACVRQQGYPLIEHIVVDGLSSDDTLAIVRTFPHVSRIISEKDHGIYDAMNKGIALASGDVIGILNSDDIYSDDGVLSAVAEIFADERVDVCYADLQYVQQDNTKKVLRTWKSGRYSHRSFYWGWMPPHPTFFVRKRVYDQVGLFNTTLRSSADYEIMLRILMKFGMEARYLPKVIVKMRAGGMSNASFRNRLRANKEDRIAWKLNGLNPYFFTLLMKPLRKVPQYFIK